LTWRPVGVQIFPDGRYTLRCPSVGVKPPSRKSLASGAALVFVCALGLMPWVADERSCPKNRRQADQKGAALLRSWLTAEQAVLWGSHRHFYVVGSDTGTRYRIRHSKVMNVDELDSRGKLVAHWCFGPQGDLAVGDVVLAQKIAWRPWSWKLWP
jgi:hypothetical protein